MISSIKSIFFDAGGTLFHPYPSVGKIYKRVASRFGSHPREEDLEQAFREVWTTRNGISSLESYSDEKVEKEWWRTLVHEVFSRVGGVNKFEAFFEELYDVFARPESWKLYPEVLEVLRELKKRKKCLGVISNWDSRLFQLCDGLGLGKYFDFVLASAVVGASKPSPRIFQEALKRVNIPADLALHVGDSYKDDISGAKRVGMRTVLIDRRADRREVREAVLDVRVIRNLKELLS